MKNWRRALQGVIAAMVIIGMVWIFPVRGIGIFPQDSVTGKGELTATGNLTDGKTVSQTFAAEQEYLIGISIYMQNLTENQKGKLLFELYDKEGNSIYRNSEELKNIPNYEWWDMKVSAKLKVGEEYRYTITTDEKDSGEALQIFKTAAENAPAENREYRYDDIKEDAASLAVSYKYRRAVSDFWEAIPYDMIVLLVGAVFIEILQKGREDGNENKE